MRLPAAIQATDHGFIRGFSTLLMHQALAFRTLGKCVETIVRWIGSEGIQVDSGMASANFSVCVSRVVRGCIGQLLQSGFHHVYPFLKINTVAKCPYVFRIAYFPSQLRFPVVPRDSSKRGAWGFCMNPRKKIPTISKQYGANGVKSTHKSRRGWKNHLLSKRIQNVSHQIHGMGCVETLEEWQWDYKCMEKRKLPRLSYQGGWGDLVIFLSR